MSASNASQKHIQLLSSLSHAQPNGREIPRPRAAQESPLLGMGLLNYKPAWGFHAGRSAATTTTEQEPRWSVLARVIKTRGSCLSGCLLFLFLCIFLAFLPSSLPSALDNLCGTSVFVILSQKFITWRVSFANTRNYKHGMETRQTAVLCTASPDFLKACIGLRGRQQMKKHRNTNWPLAPLKMTHT